MKKLINKSLCIVSFVIGMNIATSAVGQASTISQPLLGIWQLTKIAVGDSVLECQSQITTGPTIPDFLRPYFTCGENETLVLDRNKSRIRGLYRQNLTILSSSVLKGNWASISLPASKADLNKVLPKISYIIFNDDDDELDASVYAWTLTDFKNTLTVSKVQGVTPNKLLTNLTFKRINQ